jgi:hypothetical protein
MSKFKSQKDQDLAAKIIQDFQQISKNRGNFETHWQEIAQRMLPNEVPYFNAFGQTQTQGEKRTQFVFDSTAAIALSRFAAILDSLLTPRNQTWHRLMATDPTLNKRRDVQMWFDKANELLFRHRYSPRANFSSQNQKNFRALGAYGTGTLFIDELTQEPGLRYRYIHLSQIYFQENHQGIVDKAMRYFPMTARQAYQKWGEEIGTELMEKAKSGSEEQIWFIHCVKPNEDLDATRSDYKGMIYSSYYVGVKEQAILSQAGYNTFPYAISRYEQFDNEVYGRSPAMDVLPAVKTLNEQKKAMLKQAHRIVDPVLLAHDNGIVDAFNFRPGSINPGGVTANGQPLIHALPTGNLQIGKETMDDERSLIKDAFLTSIFQILTETPEMTATEVMERTREKAILLAPTIGRQQSEYLGPMIERELDLLSRQGMLPPMPQALMEAKGHYKVEYDSPISRAQRSEEVAGVMRTIENAIAVVNATQDPSPLDNFNFDMIIPEVADIQGVPPHWMNSVEQISKMRAQRAQEKQAAQVAQVAPGAAALISANAKAQQAQKG